MPDPSNLRVETATQRGKAVVPALNCSLLPFLPEVTAYVLDKRTKKEEGCTRTPFVCPLESGTL